jgi:hypothetical protein
MPWWEQTVRARGGITFATMNAPKYKLYADGSYQASCKCPELAVRIAALLGNGATVRLGHKRIVFTEGVNCSANESIDAAARALLAKSAGA